MKNPFRITGVREKLEPLIESAGLRWGDYIRCREGALDTLEKKGLIVYPDVTRGRITERQLKIIESIVGREGQQVVIIPYSSFVFPSSDSRSISKKSPLVSLRYDGSRTASEILKEKMAGVSIDDLLVGYDWQSPAGNDRRFIVTTLVDCIKGYLLDKMIGDGEMDVKPYPDPKLTPGAGAMVIVENIPSLNSRKKYSMRIEGILLYEGDEGGRKGMIVQPERTYELATSHECRKDEFYPIKYGRKIFLLGGRELEGRRFGREKLECYHSVLALKKAKKMARIRYGLEMHDPFVEPARRCTSEIFDATRNSILIQDKDGYFHAPNETQSEILMWKYIGYLNHVRNGRR